MTSPARTVMVEEMDITRFMLCSISTMVSRFPGCGANG